MFSLDNLLALNFASLVFKTCFIIFSLVYFIFSLIVIRQVNLMSETLITEAVLIFKIFAIMHALVALSAVIFFILLMV